jgi:hypothetical protein
MWKISTQSRSSAILNRTGIPFPSHRCALHPESWAVPYWQQLLRFCMHHQARLQTCLSQASFCLFAILKAGSHMDVQSMRRRPSYSCNSTVGHSFIVGSILCIHIVYTCSELVRQRTWAGCPTLIWCCTRTRRQRELPRPNGDHIVFCATMHVRTKSLVKNGHEFFAEPHTSQHPILSPNDRW